MIKRDDIKFRIGNTVDYKGKKLANCLIYIDARTAGRELDETFGKGFWRFDWEQVSMNKWAIKGRLSVFNDKLKEWVEHHDVGYPQQGKKFGDPDSTEWLKDAVSDALKRCAVQVGIGHILYDAPDLWTEKVVLRGMKVKKLSKEGISEIESKIDKWYKGLGEPV